MDADETEPQWRRICHYVSEVAVAVGVGPEACCCSPDALANAYIAVEHRLPRYPERDVALLWDEERGWAVAVETGCGEDLLVLHYLGGDVLPAPHVVASFLASVVRGKPEGAERAAQGGASAVLPAGLDRYGLHTAATNPVG
ncbi:DUF6292 family protein [Amycolatopsis palatopharyngis]|uniref:DUF6292 family protein n=1 Tax=Amycolatopsis palatopharyngis TaxID=187982 RepID=UPI000E24CA04|nr:DUF6292 family protein [Amycolatopsis palatopharyngis]